MNIEVLLSEYKSLRPKERSYSACRALAPSAAPGVARALLTRPRLHPNPPHWPYQRIRMETRSSCCVWKVPFRLHTEVRWVALRSAAPGRPAHCPAQTRHTTFLWRFGS